MDKKNSILLNVNSNNIEKDLDLVLKEQFEGLSGIFIIPKLKILLFQEINSINDMFNQVSEYLTIQEKKINELLEKRIEQEKINNIIFDPVEFFPIKNTSNLLHKQYEFCLNNKYFMKTGKLEEQTVIMIEVLDDLDLDSDDIKPNLYKISKEYRFFESKQRAIKETLFIGKIEFKKDAEKLFEMLRIL